MESNIRELIKSALQNIIKNKNKNKNKPYTDKKLVEKLNEEGYSVTENEVKKYREELIKLALKKIITNEDKNKPYTDEGLVKKLKEEGYGDVTENKVKKYREERSLLGHEKRKKKYIKLAIRQINRNKKKKNNYTNEELVKELNEEGYDNLKASDVAKYRK